MWPRGSVPVSVEQKSPKESGPRPRRTLLYHLGRALRNPPSGGLGRPLKAPHDGRPGDALELECCWWLHGKAFGVPDDFHHWPQVIGLIYLDDAAERTGAELDKAAQRIDGQQGEKGPKEFHIKGFPHVRKDCPNGLVRRLGPPVGPVVSEGLEDIRQADYLRKPMDFLAFQALGVTAPVDPLVLLAHDGSELR